MEFKAKIIKQAVQILGASSQVENAGNKLDKSERIASVFIDSAIEDVFLSVEWKAAVELIPMTGGNINEFTRVNNVDDCIKVITMNPSNIEWYAHSGKIYFKGAGLDGGFYHSSKLLKFIQNNNEPDLPSIFSMLCSLYLAAMISHSLYSDSLFTDGMNKQYLQKLEDAKRLHYFDYHLVNSARFA